MKLEGGRKRLDAVQAILDAEIPVMGHLGLTPQSVHALGGFKVQGKELEAARAIVDDAIALAEAGCFAIVLECVPDAVARLVTDTVPVPTIGIGAGRHCDGQVLVFHDLLGLEDRVRPKFVRRYAELGATAIDAVDPLRRRRARGDVPVERRDVPRGRPAARRAAPHDHQCGRRVGDPGARARVTQEAASERPRAGYPGSQRASKKWWLAAGAAGLLVVAGVGLFLLGDALTSDADDDTSPATAGALTRAVEDATPASDPFSQLTETTIRVGDETMRVVVTDDDGERYRGLRGREDIGSYDGMLFVFDGPDARPASRCRRCARRSPSASTAPTGSPSIACAWSRAGSRSRAARSTTPDGDVQLRARDASRRPPRGRLSSP